MPLSFQWYDPLDKPREYKLISLVCFPPGIIMPHSSNYLCNWREGMVQKLVTDRLSDDSNFLI